jgi:hypothetical protein
MGFDGRASRWLVWVCGSLSAAAVVIVLLFSIAVAGLAVVSDEIGLVHCSRSAGVNGRC